MRMSLGEIAPRYREAVVLLAGTCAIITGTLIDGVLRPLVSPFAAMALSAFGFLMAGYLSGLVFRSVIGRDSIDSAASVSASVEQTEADFVEDAVSVVRSAVCGVVSLICLIAAVANLRALFIGKFDPITLAAVAGTGSWCIIAFVGSFSLNLVGRRNLALGLVIGNLVCLVLALISFVISPSNLAIIVIVWCAVIVILPLLKIDLWWTKG